MTLNSKPGRTNYQIDWPIVTRQREYQLTASGVIQYYYNPFSCSADEFFRDQAAEQFERHTHSAWRPRSGSMVNHRTLTFRVVPSRVRTCDGGEVSGFGHDRQP